MGRERRKERGRRRIGGRVREGPEEGGRRGRRGEEKASGREESDLLPAV